MDMSGEVAETHMKTDAKNLVTTARTIHLPDAFPQTGFSASENSVEQEQGHPWESDDRTIPTVQFEEAILRGFIQEKRLGWHQFPWILSTIGRTLFWILVAHDYLDQEKQSGGSKKMRCIMASRQNAIPATSLLCLPTLRQNLSGKLFCSFSDKTTMFHPETGDVPIRFSLAQITRSQDDMSSFLACTLIQSSIRQWNILCCI